MVNVINNYSFISDSKISFNCIRLTIFNQNLIGHIICLRNLRYCNVCNNKGYKYK